MNVLDIFKQAISVEPDSVYLEIFDSDDYRCTFSEWIPVNICNKETWLKGRVFWYNAGSETLETFWNDCYYCSSDDFRVFIEQIRELVPSNNFCCARFKSLSEEQTVLGAFNSSFR